MKLKPNVATSAAGFVFNPATGDSFAANPVAAEVLRLLQRECTAAELHAHLRARYDVDAARLDRDLDELLTQLREFNLLAP